ncbi:hypothetical protein PAAG_02639 [Paracoccidioides lutzii Pb01]|uniref:Uncharacterized protein n=1 Tax=Paracoccidioides lutzii (strain ATCC MYA-826 / Pb01) TaxID=502779 RepID=C1GVU4_PARBA|nr:hypothetical protein PAAG_02639 [Paracoccidioides lutzii Pb01]EEH40663.2 hypothetical protein PAAG_02639 [Paracoccidioides lutzii Pb01]
MISHRSTRLFVVVVFFAIFLLILSSTPSTSLSTSPSLHKNKASSYIDSVPRPNLPNLLPNFPNLPNLPKLPTPLGLPDINFRIPFPHSVHKPPEQKNSTSGETKWYSDWRWLNPFSSSITLDENRSVLPPLPPRTLIFAYYDSASKKQKGEAEADRQLLLTWRRAWWAKGFRPVVLGPAEAMNNHIYQEVKAKGLNKELEGDLMRWLAWGSVDSGILADWRCFPMTDYEDKSLVSLRRGTDPEFITRFENLGTGLFSGERSHVNVAIKSALDRDNLKDAKNMIDVVPDQFFMVEKSTSFAYYDPTTVVAHYSPIAEKIDKNPSAGKLALVDLINLHLQVTFQNTFSSGISVPKPFPKATTVLVNPAVTLAGLLAKCAPSMLQTSCPPNNPSCKPCTPRYAYKILQPSSYFNNSAIYTIGVLPHPYTLISIQSESANVTIPYIRRETDRDRWLVEATKSLLGERLDGSSRVVVFKNIVAGNFGMSNSLWFTVESFPANPKSALPSETVDDLEWHFGFRIPREKAGDSQTTFTGVFPGGAKEKIKTEFELIGKARQTLESGKKEDKKIREASEAWNLADTEVWRFVRAYRARSVIERKKWEQDEKGYAGS